MGIGSFFRNLGHDIKHGFESIGQGVEHVAGSVAHTVEGVASGALRVAGDVVYGQFGKALKDLEKTAENSIRNIGHTLNASIDLALTEGTMLTTQRSIRRVIPKSISASSLILRRVARTQKGLGGTVGQIANAGQGVIRGEFATADDPHARANRQRARRRPIGCRQRRDACRLADPRGDVRNSGGERSRADAARP